MKMMPTKVLRLVCVAPVLALVASRPGVALAQAFPTEPPPPLPERSIEFPTFVDRTLPNGLRLVVLEHRSQPLVSVNLYVGAGAAFVSPDRAGLASMTADLLTKGTVARTATEIAAEIERVGGSLNASAGVDWVTLSSQVLAEDLPLALELVSQSAMQPTFPAEELELTRRRTLSSLRSALGNAAAVAQRIFDREVYGASHPYGVSPVPSTVEAVTRDDIVAFHDRLFAASNALLIVAGDVDAARVEDLVVRHFGSWKRGEPARVEFPTTQHQDRTEIRLVHRPGSAQTNILIGHLGFRPATPDYFPLVVLNGVLGGHPDARLFKILREQRGWTYGSYSRFTRPREIGVFDAEAETRTEVTDSAVVEILAQMRRIREERVPEDELAATKSFLAGSFPLRIETAQQIATSIATTLLLGLPVENLTQYRERVLAVTAADVQRVAREYLRPEQAVVVVVGDAVELLPRLQTIAPVRVFDVEGEPLDPASLTRPQ